MAITPFEQRIGVPNGGGVSQGVNVSLADLGPAVQQLADNVLRTAEPILRDRAIAQGRADAGAIGTIKNPDGTWSMPETPEGGLVYARSFDEAKQTQYVLHVSNDFELALNQIYYSPDAIGKTPEELNAQATALFNGTMKGVDPSVQPLLFEGMTREIRQRDLQASNAYMRQQEELMTKDFAATARDSQTKAMLYYGDNNDAAAETERLKGRAAVEGLVKIGKASQGDLDRYDEGFASAKAAGDVLGMFRTGLANGQYMSSDMALMSDMLRGIDPEGSTIRLGDKDYTGPELRALIPDEQHRNHLASLFDKREADTRREEAEAAKAAENSGIMEATPMGGNRPYGVSDEKWSAAVLEWAQQNGINPMTPEGFTQIYNRTPDLPAFYNQQLSNMRARTPDELETMRPLFNTMSNMLGRDGQTINVVEQVLSPQDSAFFYHYEAARTLGVDKNIAKERALKAADIGLAREGQPLETMLIENGQFTGTAAAKRATLWDRLDDHTGVKWDQLGSRAQKAIELDVAQQVATGVPFDVARKNAGIRFKANWTTSNYTLGTGYNRSRGKGAEWIPRSEALPTVIDVNNPKGPGWDGWVAPYVNGALNNWMGAQVPGVPGRADLKFGQNVWLKPTGRVTREGGTQFALVYFDPKKGNMPTTLMNKDGVPIMLDFNRAHKIQQKAMQDFIVGKAQSERAVGQSRARAGIVPGAMRVGDPRRIEEAKRIEAEHNARYNSGKRPYGPLRLDDVRPPELETQMLRNTKASRLQPAPPEIQSAYVATANRLGVSPLHLAAIVSYETGGTMSPRVRGGKGNQYIGIFQASPDVRRKYGISERSTIPQQLAALEKYAKDRGYVPGMGWRKLYTTINAGNPKASVYAHDGNGNQLDHYRKIEGEHYGNARGYLGR